ncbi:hypothetical protein RclHR1_03570005 [Rhizophagus clarus]|uniref:Protein kinase domain-containing protein n=1 Tax=Rhizophagus clarus TaxID=94130 RepID=A0A2Z6RB00_9GLOM|nr:hypothetical protein RclHR1_03570005 [Rhizophagus clarus]
MLQLKDNFKNWTSGNDIIDEFIQQSQLNAVCYINYIEWIPFEKFQNITYIAEGGFGKVYAAEWPEGNIEYWDIEDQKWYRYHYNKYALKSLNNSSDISSDFLNEFMQKKIGKLRQLASGLLDIHNAGLVHKDFHSGNILFNIDPVISDLGMCQPANKQTVKEEGIYGVLPYMAPEVLRGHQYTKAADIYSFGIIINELLSEEIPFNDIPHDKFLAIKVCNGLRPNISKDVPKLLVDLITKCWDAEIDNRPTTNELHQLLKKWVYELRKVKNVEGWKSNEICSQVDECNKLGKKKFEISKSSKGKSDNIQTHPQAIYTSRLLNFKNLPKPVNSSDLSSCQLNSGNFTLTIFILKSIY